MSNRRCTGILLLVAPLLLALAPPQAGIEPWADPGLAVPDGLELWLDATRVGAARQSLKQAALRSGDALDIWLDASGHGRHVRQEVSDARPHLVQLGDAWVVRFDGLDDHLRRTGLNWATEAFTLFVVAAPHDNPGDFRGFFAANAPGGRDYETGFTLDMNFGPTFQLEQLNVEGKGFGGARNLLDRPSPFDTLHVIEARAVPDAKKVQLFLDGRRTGERPFQPGPLRLDEIAVGARYYTNGPGPQQVRGFLPGDIAEVLLFGRVLGDDDTKRVRQYLDRKYTKLRAALPAELQRNRVGQPLVRVANPPPVQMLVPGFTVRQLPVDLTNINNVKYRPDGKLVALAYNGDVFLLSDSDGDGLEDKVEVFWKNQGRLRAPVGLALTPPGYRHGDGIFVPSKGKLSLLVDTDGDGKADKEIIVAQGWKELPLNVDALGVAVGPDGSVYFGLGCADFSSAYLVDRQGKAHYDLKSERGTIQRVSPDFRTRETVCTGIRFSVALAFNRHGDLFCTDQEGATWLPNGNPLDELLHIQPGRHYGFPPRHPRHLPNVIDEPSVFDYGPQHQSTCGLNFKESVNGGPTFGPATWAGDALICGESRGKLYRTKLVKSPHGYIAQTQEIARLNALTIDACISPRGELVVATHSGPPDWGTGPSGKGKLYKITYSDPGYPQPAAVWAAGPGEVRVAFDRPLDPQHLRQLASLAKLTRGEYVRAGDRFESLTPPYAVVQMQQRTPRFDVPVLGAAVTADRRTLILTTAPRREAVHYAITLPPVGPAAKPPANALPQHPEIDLDYTLTGVEATWTPRGAGSAWSGWLPHLDLDAARAFTQGSAGHEPLWEALKTPGALTLRTHLNLTDMLRPAIQPGSRIDYEWPAEQVTLTFTAARAFNVRYGNPPVELSRSGAGPFEVSLTVNPKGKQPLPVEITFPALAGAPGLRVSWHTAEDARPRALPLRRLLLPWAEVGEHKADVVVRRDVPELKGGSWARGRQVFRSEEAACAKCHTVQGEGGAIGPDLSNLVHRDYASVLRDITEPSFAINPDYITYAVTLKDGRLLTGPVRSQGDQLLVGDEKGQTTTVRRGDVEQLTPTSKSIMPEGIVKLLGPERMKDLLTFLLLGPPRMPLDAREPPPPPRARAEVLAALAGAPKPHLPTRPLHVVLVAGKKDHGPGEHDYPAWQKAWAELLAAGEQTKVSTAWDWPAAADLQTADVLIFYQHGSWTPERARDIDAFLARGGGLVYVHWAVDGSPDAPGFAQRIGLAARGGQIHFRHGPLDLGFEAGPRHPIARNFHKVHFHDESYWGLTGDPGRINLLASSVEDGQPRPQFWTLEPGKGRVFVSVPGHYSWTFDDPLFRILLLRGIAWTARDPVDRFNDLVFPGARLAD
jgi:putative heme-binding domain-containing protein